MRDSANVLNSLAGHSQDPNYKFERLYRLLFNENLYALAYQKLSQNAGNYTKGTDGQTIDGMSIKHIHSIIGQLKDESYRPCPARRIYIPKKNGKQRPLGIPAFKDKLVQEVVRMILESIYEGHFEDCSHGFRPHRGCHTAMASLQKGGTGARWFIEGDIKGFFDNINHDVLIGILAERINDERFLRLIRKFLKAGYMEQWEYKNSYIGTPQGGIISPILANIYLDKLDKFMRNYINVFNKGKARVRNPEYKRVANRKDKFVLTICNPFIFGVAYTCFTFIEDVYVVPHKFIEFVKINIRQNRTYYASLRCSDIGIFVLPLFHVACFEEFTYQSQETLVIDSFSKDSD